MWNIEKIWIDDDKGCCIKNWIPKFKYEEVNTKNKIRRMKYKDQRKIYKQFTMHEVN